MSARTSVGDTPRIVIRWRSTIDQSRSGSGEVGRTVEAEHRRAPRERAEDLPRPHDPAEVGEPEQDVVGTAVRLEPDLLGDLREEPAVDVHRALRPAGRAARVRDEQRVLGVHRARDERLVRARGS